LQFIGNDGPLYSYNESDDNICNNKEYFIAERKQQWGNLSDMAREQFYWEDPGISYTSTWAKGEGIPAGGRDDDGKVLPPPDTFLLMLLNPTTIDYLRLGDNFRQVDKWEDGQWLSTRVNP
jgi:pyridoxamine 5'-phosphate oxidase